MRIESLLTDGAHGTGGAQLKHDSLRLVDVWATALYASGLIFIRADNETMWRRFSASMRFIMRLGCGGASDEMCSGRGDDCIALTAPEPKTSLVRIYL